MLILNLLNSATKQMVADFGKNMYSDLLNTRLQKLLLLPPLNDEEEIGMACKTNKSGLHFVI